jgi:hypothetical protein
MEVRQARESHEADGLVLLTHLRRSAMLFFLLFCGIR